MTEREMESAAEMLTETVQNDPLFIRGYLEGARAEQELAPLAYALFAIFGAMGGFFFSLLLLGAK